VLPDHIQHYLTQTTACERSVHQAVRPKSVTQLSCTSPAFTTDLDIVTLTVFGEGCTFGDSSLLYILESKPHPFYIFRGLKNQMRIRFAVVSWILEKW